MKVTLALVLLGLVLCTASPVGNLAPTKDDDAMPVGGDVSMPTNDPGDLPKNAPGCIKPAAGEEYKGGCVPDNTVVARAEPAKIDKLPDGTQVISGSDTKVKKATTIGDEPVGEAKESSDSFTKLATTEPKAASDNKLDPAPEVDPNAVDEDVDLLGPDHCPEPDCKKSGSEESSEGSQEGSEQSA